MKNNNEVMLVRHLKDENSLLKEGLDGSLLEGQEKEAEKIANDIYENAEKNKVDILMFITSPQKRAIGTAQLIEDGIKGKKSKIKTMMFVDDKLRTLDQGKYILPDGYTDGDHFEGLEIAKKIFNSEKFSEDPTFENLKYRFGDPLKLSDGGYKYPELLKYFSEPGESYRDFLVRIYEDVAMYSEKIGMYNNKVQPVLFTHNLVTFVLRDLKELSNKVLHENLTFKTGQVAKLCLQIYKEGNTYNKTTDKDYGRLDFIDASNVFVPQIVKLLKEEIEFLKKI